MDDDALLDAYLDDALDETGLRVLNQRLADEPRLAARLAERSRLHRQLWRAMAALHTSQPEPTAAQGAMTSRRYRRRRTGRRRQATVALVALLIVVGGLVLLVTLQREAEERTVAPSPGLLLVAAEATQHGERPAEADAPVAVGDRLRSGADGSFQLRFADGSTLQVFAGDLQVASLDPVRLRLDRGRAEVLVAERVAERGFAITLPHATATVVGTRFTVTASPDRSTLSVAEGRVAFDDGVLRRLVPAGASVSAPADDLEPAFVGVRDFVLIDCTTGDAVDGFDPIADGAVIDPEALGLRAYTIVAHAAGGVSGMRMYLDGELIQQEAHPPFSLFGNTPVVPGEPIVFTPAVLSPGLHRVRAEPTGPPAAARATISFRIQSE